MPTLALLAPGTYPQLEVEKRICRTRGDEGIHSHRLSVVFGISTHWHLQLWKIPPKTWQISVQKLLIS
ncbi:hypothetical protein GN956_G17438 [Arapaima gigas]